MHQAGSGSASDNGSRIPTELPSFMQPQKPASWPACIVLMLLAITLAWPAVGAASAPGDADPPTVYVFWREGCPHCERAIAWARGLATADAPVTVRYQEVGRTTAQQALLADVVMQFDLDRVAVPLIVVGERAFIGFLDADSTGRDIEAAIRSCQTDRCTDRIAPRLAALDPAKNEASAPGEREVANITTPSIPNRIRVPLLGEIDLAGLSLAALTVVLAAADGFNPCAMWTLVFLLGLIAGMRDRVRMWTLGIAFVAASAGVYFLFMAAWLNVLLMLGMVVWLRMALGALAIGGGIYSLMRGFSREAPVCTVTAPASRRKVLDGLRTLALEQRFGLALIGIVLIAVAVNIVELICSAGIPAVYTQILALTEMPRWRHYAYLMLYVAVFMLDDLAVLVVTLGAITIAGQSAAYSRWSNRIGGIILIGLGVLLLLRPDWLALG